MHRSLALSACLSASHQVLAAQGTDMPLRLPGPEGLATTVLGLALVLGLIFAVAWVLKRVGGLPPVGRGLVRVVGGAALGARERVVVVEVEGVRLVLGVAPGRVQTLHILPAREAGFAGVLDKAREQAS
jgi:flagellar protein FliO/FliZ